MKTADSYDAADIVVQERRDGLYDLLKHRNTVPKNGLTKREMTGFVGANPALSVLMLPAFVTPEMAN